MAIGDLSNSLAEISKLPDDQLRELCETQSDQRYDDIVEQTDRIKNLQAERELTMVSIRSLAEFNLARRNDYERDRSLLLTLVSDTNKLKQDIKDKSAKLLELSRKTSLDSTLSVVLNATAQAEKNSENVANCFLDKTLDLDSFLSQYSGERTLAHLRRIKADRLRQESKESWACQRSQNFNL